MSGGELKACPFCKGRALITREPCLDGGGAFAHAKCVDCGSHSREHYYSYGNDCPQMYAEIRAEWNARVGSGARLKKMESPV